MKNQSGTPKTADLCVCPQCGESFNLADVKRSLGKESFVVLLKLCSAQCYTNKTTGVPPTLKA